MHRNVILSPNHKVTISKSKTHLNVSRWATINIPKTILQILMKLVSKQNTQNFNPMNAYINQIKMLETTSNLSIQENRSQMGPTHQFSLPLINKKKHELNKYQGEYFDKEKLALPHINNSRNNPQTLPQYKRKSQNLKSKSRKDFSKEVKAKLDLVLGEMETHGAAQRQNDSEDEDFEAKINQNKQIIKMHRLKKQKQNAGDSRNKKRSEHKIKEQIKPRKESLYQKRVKEYKDQSIENKYLQKKKQYIKLKKGHNIYYGDEGKQMKSRQEYNSLKNNKKEENRSVSKKNYPRASSHKPVDKTVTETSKNLFDGIQNLLENPQEGHKKSVTLVGLGLLKAKRDIEDKIRQLNNKLGIQDSGELSPTKIQMKPVSLQNLQMSAKEWRKIEIKAQKVSAQTSNFEKQLQKINELQERNSQCLEAYIQQQKILLQLQLRQKQLSRKAHANSH